MRGRVIWKRRIGRLYALMRARDAQRRLVLMFHSVGGGPDATESGAFRDYMDAVADMGHLLPLENLLVATPGRGVAVAITFDDGYAALKEHASPILADFGCTATVFLNAGEIADAERRSSNVEDGYYPGEQFLTWRDVDALRAMGWRFGSHGVHHLDLTRVDAATAKYELTTSKAMIERRLGSSCDLFAYPYGHNHSSLRTAVRAAGYRYAFAGDHSSLTGLSDRFRLPRINVAKEYARDDLVAILRGDWDYLHWVLAAKAVMR